MNLLDPLTSFHWRECTEGMDFKFWQTIRACSFGGELYLADSSDLYRISADLSSWKALRVPSEYFTLTAYRNQLVLFGGLVDSGFGRTKATDKVWVSDNGEHWDDSSLPPLTSGRISATAVNTGKPEFLVVFGGLERRDIVEVLIDRKECEPHWASLQSLPGKFTGQLRPPVLHNGNLMFRDCYCKLEELKAECEVACQSKPQLEVRPYLRSRTGSGMIAGRPLTCNSELWKRSTLSLPLNVVVISYKQQLLGFTRYNNVMIFSPTDDDDDEGPWINIDTVTVPGHPQLACVHSTGDIVVLSNCTTSATVPRPGRAIGELFSATVRGGVTSLNKQCVYVIMSALLEQQESLDPDQLPTRLPDYVPPNVKHYLARTLRMRTSVPAPPDLPSRRKRRRKK